MNLFAGVFFMQIKSLSFPPLPPAATDRHSSGADRFREELEAAVGRRPAVPESPTELAAAVRLHMLSQAARLGEDGSEAESDTSSPLPFFSSMVSRKYAAWSHKNDFSEVQPPASSAGYPAESIAAPKDPESSSALSDIIERAAARYQVPSEVVRR
jgi:hypothetical protein